MIPVTIYRDRWYRGQGSGASKLLRYDGRMCCVGFMCLAGGATEEDILEKLTVVGFNVEPQGRFRTNLPALALFLGTAHSEAAMQIYGANDRDFGGYTEVTREQEITTLAAKLGFEVTFADVTPAVLGPSPLPSLPVAEESSEAAGMAEVSEVQEDLALVGV